MPSEFFLDFLDGKEEREHTLTVIEGPHQPAGSQETKHRFVVDNRTSLSFCRAKLLTVGSVRCDVRYLAIRI